MRTALLIASLAITPSLASANLVEVFHTDSEDASTTLAGSVYTRILTGLECDGVTFDATLTAAGASGLFGSGNLTVNGGGLGVDDANIGANESVTFTMTISNITPSPDGRGIAFNGFTSVDLTGLAAFESATFASDEVGSVVINGPTEEFGFANSASFTISGPTGFSPTQFNISNVTGSFVSTPEPSSLSLVIGLCPLLLRRRRR